MKGFFLLITFVGTISSGYAQQPREIIAFDDGWYFSFGHPFDKAGDLNHGTGYFSYLAKAGYGDGAAAAGFDHRAWRPLDLPHDWAVEMPFDQAGSHSHGYRAVGPGFPDTSVGWYRKTFDIRESDFGRQFFLDFDGVSRDAKVWVNGHYLGHEPSGYQSFAFNITDILNYGGENVVAVRADVTLEEGWFYEGAGIYRPVWLRKTPALHIPKDGTFVHAKLKGKAAQVTIETEVDNRGNQARAYTLHHQVLNKEGAVLAKAAEPESQLLPMKSGSRKCMLQIMNPELWSLENPYLHTMLTQVKVDGKVVDEYRTPFGIRSIRFDADQGFFLNGKHVKLKGTNNHQDHAGVGSAMPDELIRWRLQQLKNFGCNAYRSSHNPPAPSLLKLCDEMGMLVIDENRLMGTTEGALHELDRLIKRDRNHPSVIAWSLGNEEWAIEGNETGARITITMQDFARRLDPTRPANVAISGGWDVGIGSVVEVMGYNYLAHGDTDEHHARFPHQPSMGTEEGSTFATRGIYFDDDDKHYKSAYDVAPRPGWFSIEGCWTHYAERDYLSGMFIWTGFDYRGEPTPYAWPSVTSYFGMMDLCGFPKDNVYYLKAWWQDEPVLHILPHWNWPGREGERINVWVYSNCEDVELMLNGASLGRKTMPQNGHIEWQVPYAPGALKAIGFNQGKRVLESQRVTAGPAKQIRMTSHKLKLKADNRDLAILTVEAVDENGNSVPTAGHDIQFNLAGEGKIIGVGNGNPTSHEKERVVNGYAAIRLHDVELNELTSETTELYLPDLPLSEKNTLSKRDALKTKMLMTSFHVDTPIESDMQPTWFYKHVGTNQRIYLNGKLLAENVMPGEAFKVPLNVSDLNPGENRVVIIAEPFMPKNEWDTPNRQPGSIQLLTPAPQWHRKLFNGLAQVLVQSTRQSGEIILKASSPNLHDAEIRITTE